MPSRWVSRHRRNCVSSNDDPAAPIADEMQDKRRRKPILASPGKDKFEGFKERDDLEYVPEPPTY